MGVYSSVIYNELGGHVKHNGASAVSGTHRLTP